ncbi:putative flavin-containing monooxygenase 1 [Bidens hawaiensis]|uniref:putative flavin-containing monooxygenase 1 n=1 Tax=Bidens hawaiensis TaxID=980011 RepID=UPI0040497EED
MVPQHSLLNDFSSGLVLYMPYPTTSLIGFVYAISDNFFDAVDKGSIKLKKSPSFEFYEKGILIGDDNTHIEEGVVIFAIGFNGVDKLERVFESQTFRHYITDPPRVPLYRESIHPRIPQLAVVGFSDGLSSLYTSEMRCRWVAALLEGAVKLPSVKEMQKDVVRWDEYMKQSSGEFHSRSFFGGIEIWYNDLLCKDMGMNPTRKKRTDGTYL